MNGNSPYMHRRETLVPTFVMMAYKPPRHAVIVRLSLTPFAPTNIHSKSAPAAAASIGLAVHRLKLMMMFSQSVRRGLSSILVLRIVIH